MSRHRWPTQPRITSSNAAKFERGLQALFKHLGEDPKREGLRETPARVVKAFVEMTTGYNEDPAKILSKEFGVADYDEMIVVTGLAFWSLCEHHLLPFHGTATIGYIPDKKVVGLSKLPRLVHCFARRLQIQEQLTSQIANAFQDNVKPKGCGVILEAGHLCMACRGVKTPGMTKTSALRGVFKSQPETRAEFFAHHRS